jgi:LPS-assembly lipoprotein
MSRTGSSMSCRNRFIARPMTLACIAVVLAIAALSGCGFEPLHSRIGGAEAARLAEIKILPILDREGQILSNFLRDRLTPLGPPRRPTYVLSVKVTENQVSLGVRADEFATRANLNVIALFNLQATDGSDRKFFGRATSTSSFNILSSSFATLTAEKDARERSLRQISDEIKSRISIYLGRVR